MKIPKVFGNKLILAVVALALFAIVIFSFFKVINIETTGFVGLGNKEKQNQSSIPTPLENSDNNNQGNPFSIIILTNNSESQFNFTNLSSGIIETSRNSGRGSHGGGSGSSGNPNQGGINHPPNNNSNNTNPNLPPYLKKKLTKKPKNLNLKMNNMELNEGDEFEGKVRFSLEKSNKKISSFNINFSRDIDLSDIIGDTDLDTGKSFMHSTSGVLEDIDLYVPIKEGIDSIIICSNASSYDEIYYGCSNNSHVTNEEILYLNNSRIEISSDDLYYIVHGITGTGAVGVNVTNLSSSSQNATPPGSADAFAGNITQISIPQGYGITQAWQGYFGNISGVIQLADSGDNVLYNWSLASPEGEIFASTNNSIVWNYIQCLNFYSDGTYEDDTGNAGGTSAHGTNLTQLESQYNIDSYDIDGVDETFTLIGPGTHNTFYVNANEFNEGECQNTRIIDSSGWPQDDHFEEVLMYEPTTQSVIFASLLNEDVPGFDNNPHDFEMLVLEDGHETDTSPTTYYFYAVMF